MKKILVVEDAQSLRKDIVEMLGFEGFEAIGAENGLVGVDRARQVLLDLIICDIMMPGLDGYGVLEELRKDTLTSTIPFIFLTARTDRVDVRQGMELGADDFEFNRNAGNMELQLDRKLSNRRVYPAIDVPASGTRREDLLMKEEELKRVWILRKFMADMNSVEAMEFLQSKMKGTRNNEEFLTSMNG